MDIMALHKKGNDLIKTVTGSDSVNALALAARRTIGHHISVSRSTNEQEIDGQEELVLNAGTNPRTTNIGKAMECEILQRVEDLKVAMISYSPDM